MNRRGFLQACLAAGVAPAVVGSGILMPLRQLWTPGALVETLDGASFPIMIDQGDIFAAAAKPSAFTALVSQVWQAHSAEFKRSVERSNTLLLSPDGLVSDGRFYRFSGYRLEDAEG